MLFPELKQRRDRIRVLMAQHGIDAALITCNVNLIYTYGRVVSGYLYLPLNDFARLFVKRPATLEGEHVVPIRKPEQLPELIKECGLPLPKKLMLEGDELPFTEYNRLAACFPEAETLFAVPGRMIFRIFHRGLLTSAWKFVIINIVKSCIDEPNILVKKKI